MPLYYFHLRTRDAGAYGPRRGRNLPDLSAALTEAQHAARALLRKGMRRARGEQEGVLDIEDEKHQPVARILLAKWRGRSAETRVALPGRPGLRAA